MAEENTNRRLAAILVADVVGYSRLMGIDEAGTLHRLQQHRYTLINPTIGQYQGRIVKLMGDGILVEFPSVINAVDCAVSIQRGMVRQNADLADDQSIRFRMGINLGDVLIEGDDIYGEGVNIAARLEQLAEPDSVYISGTVFGQIEGTTDHDFVDIGSHKLKNIAKPIHVYAFTASQSAEPIQAAFRPFVDLPTTKAANATGGCLCGSIRYEITEPALGSMYCHCRICQRFTGAPLFSGTTFKTAAVRITQGQPKYYKSSVIAERGFCPDCGSSLIYRGLIGVWTEWLMICTASLDDPENYPPTYHLGVESTMPWLELHDDLPRTRCEDSPSLVEAYRLANQL